LELVSVTEPLEKCVELLLNASYVIALTGAGISQESNVPTFRGEEGIWRQYNAMELATPNAFHQNPSLVWEWYAWRQDLIAKCQPNPAHLVLAKWETKGILKTLITQNVDGLHRRAGSKNLLLVHGSLWKLKCTRCAYKSDVSAPETGIPQCPDCQANLRPDVVWFGESLSREVLDQVLIELERSDVIMVVGTSAMVQPSASFPLIVQRRGGRIIEVNTEATPLTAIADVHLRGKAGELLSKIDDQL
jgi:NAD-dependent deacetylase